MKIHAACINYICGNAAKVHSPETPESVAHTLLLSSSCMKCNADTRMGCPHLRVQQWGPVMHQGMFSVRSPGTGKPYPRYGCLGLLPWWKYLGFGYLGVSANDLLLLGEVTFMEQRVFTMMKKDKHINWIDGSS